MRSVLVLEADLVKIDEEPRLVLYCRFLH